MKTSGLIVATLMLIAAMSSTFAEQGEQGERERGARNGHHRGMQGRESRDPARMVERMARHLELDELQQEKLNNVVSAAKPEFEALHERARTNREAMRALDTNDPDYSSRLNELALESGEVTTARTILMGRVRSEINNELTDEQRAKLAERGEHRGERQRNRGGEDPQAK